MAAGDILSATIPAEGWYVDLVVEGFAPGATYNFGLTADNVPTAATPYLTVVSEGYNAAGVLGTATRKVYLTIVTRQAHPLQTSLAEFSETGNLRVRVALSEFVYDDDRAGGAGTSGTDPVLTVPAGFITSGGIPSAAVTAMPVVNSSTRDYPVVKANWARTDRERLTTPSLTLAAVALHQHGRDGKAVAAVRFDASNGTQSGSVVVAAPTYDSTRLDAMPVVEHVGTLDLTGWADDAQITAHFVAMPWVGDENSVINTAAVASVETDQYPAQFYVLDTDGSRGYPIVVVDPINGNDSTASTTSVKASDTEANRASAASTPHLTVHRAMRALYDFNNANNARANASGGRIYIRGGGTVEISGGDTSTPQATGTGNVWTWTDMLPFPDEVATVTPSVTATNRYLRTPGIKFVGLKFTRAADYYFARGGASTTRFFAVDCEFEDTRVSNTQSDTMFGFGAGSYLRCTFKRVAARGSNRVRGCRFPLGYTVSGRFLMAGNDYVQDSTISQSSIITAPSAQSNDYEGSVIAFNRWYKLKNDLLTAFNIAGITYTRGLAFVQNMVEFLDTAGEPGIRMSSDGTTSITNDCVIAHNTVAGQRCNLFYNDTGTAATPHLNHAVVLNIIDYYATKGDTFSGNGGADGARTGNWAIDNAVHNNGNIALRGEFDQRFKGLYGKSGDNTTPLDVMWVDKKSGGSGNVGGGDYHLQNTSPALALAVPQLLSIDLDGLPRAAVDAAGAYRGPAVVATVKRRLGLDNVTAIRSGTATVSKLYLGTVEV